jgi:pimeloyl-ACP methyl ester carboxylesterase
VPAGAAAACLAAFAGVGVADARPPVSKLRVGTVTAAAPLPRKLWVPGTVSKAVRLTYVTTNARGKKALSTGELFVPKGRAPKDGWPVISWAHGTSGIGDSCAPSVRGPALPQRDFPVLRGWMKQGYALVASDYAGLGTPGLHAYLHGRSEAHSVVDMVKAGRAYARAQLPPRNRLARKWVVVGQSQGAGAAIYTARYATRFGGRRLDYRGAVGTGTPAYIEEVMTTLLGPQAPPPSVGITTYLTFILTGVRYAHPALRVDNILTPTGRLALRLAEHRCVSPFEGDLRGVKLADYFTGRAETLPNWKKVIDDYLKLPEKGFDKPFFMGHGLKDVDVPYGLAARYVASLKANRQPVSFKTYNNDHSGTLLTSQKDAHRFGR